MTKATSSSLVVAVTIDVESDVGEGMTGDGVKFALRSVVPFEHPVANRNAAMSRIQIRMRVFTFMPVGLSVDDDKGGEIILKQKRFFRF